MRILRALVPSCLLALLLAFGAVAGGQNTEASLTGQVLDASGSAIAGAQVVVTNADTNISRTVTSDSAGRYQVTNLNPGRYNVKTTMANFATKEEKGLVLEISQQELLNITLAVGNVGEVVDVTANAAVTDTESAEQGAVINNQQVVGLPLNQRTFYSLAELAPAVYLPGQSSTLGFRGGFNVAGNNETANTFTVNGIDDNDQNVMAPSFRPSVEAIQEFKILTGVYSAEYGRTSGGQVVVITKTGGNQIHGDLFEFVRNSQFDAKNYFTVPGTATTFRRNQFGGTIGGPIIKDKLFFFLSYEGLRLAQPTVGSTTVPNPAFLNGDFSSVCTSGFTAGVCNTASQQLKNPVTKANYANNQIPVSTFDPIGKYILQQYPAPNAGFNPASASLPYTLNEKRIENLDEGSARVDYTISSKDTITGQYNYFNDPSFEPSLSLCSSALIPGSGCTQNQISTLAGINETHIFGPHWLNEFRIGFDRLEQPRIGQDDSITTAPKVPGAFLDPHIPANLLGGAPSSSVTGYASVHPYTNLPQHRYDDHFNLVENATWSHGAHTLKFGANILQARYSDLYVADATGVFTFTGVAGSTGNLTTGNSAADVALGFAATATRSPTAPDLHVRYNAFGFYAEDAWKATSHLTITAGMRYEDFLPIHDTRNILSNYILPSANGPFAGTSGGINVAGQTGQATHVFNNDENNFGPRLGIAYQPYGSDKTVIHAAYGIFYNSPAIGNGADLSLGLNVPFRLIQSFSSTPTAQSVLSTNPFPNVPGVTPTGTATAPFTSVSPTGIDVNFRTMFIDEYGADIQQQLSPTISLTIGYIGNNGEKIPRLVEPNQGINPVVSAAQNSVSSTRPLTGLNSAPIANPLALAAPGNPAPPQLYAQFANIAEYLSVGHGNYNALTVAGKKSLGNGISFLLSYTWSHSIDNAPGYASTSQASSGTPQNSFNLQAEKGTSDFNVAQRLALSPVIELPFGRNKAYLNHGFASGILGNFQLSGIYQYDSGRPFTISSSQNRSGSVYGVDRPNQIANPNNGPKTVKEWFNTSAFAINNYGTFGNESRNAVIGPDLSQLDVAIQKVIPFGDRYAVSLRFESFDVMNKPNFLNPLGTSTGEYIPASTAQGAAPTGSPLNNNQAVGSTAFGQLTQANDPRSIQFSGKFTF